MSAWNLGMGQQGNAWGGGGWGGVNWGGGGLMGPTGGPTLGSPEEMMAGPAAPATPNSGIYGWSGSTPTGYHGEVLSAGSPQFYNGRPNFQAGSQAYINALIAASPAAGLSGDAAASWRASLPPTPASMYGDIYNTSNPPPNPGLNPGDVGYPTALGTDPNQVFGRSLTVDELRLINPAAALAAEQGYNPYHLYTPSYGDFTPRDYWGNAQGSALYGQGPDPNDPNFAPGTPDQRRAILAFLARRQGMTPEAYAAETGYGG